MKELTRLIFVVVAIIAMAFMALNVEVAVELIGVSLTFLIFCGIAVVGIIAGASDMEEL